jgi:hypothetical protein
LRRRWWIFCVPLFLAAPLGSECEIISCHYRAHAQQGQNRTENAPPVLSNGEAAEQKRAGERAPDKPPENAARAIWHLWEETLAKPEAFWAFMVAIVTLALVISTAFLWLSTRKLAKTAARALIELERPFVYVEITQRGFGTSADGRLRADGQLVYQCVNLGRTPADIWNIVDNVVEIDKDKWPEPVIPSRGARTMPPGVVAAPDKPYICRYDLRNRFGQSRGVNGRETNMFFIGYVRYADIFGNRYVTGFCAMHDPVSWEFVLRGSDRYNYTRPEKQSPWQRIRTGL